jgi:hypothetical protein
MTTGTLSTAGQHDWLAVSLTSNQAYLFTITGLTSDASVFVGAGDDLDADGQILGQVFTSPFATAQTQTVWFDPSTSGTYYLDISDPDTIGGYSVSATTVSAGFTDNTSTTGVVTVGGSATTGTLSTAGQHDWLAVTLTANQAYLFTVTGLTNDASVFVGSADDLDADGQILGQVFTFPSATAQTQTVWFDPSTSGTYYLDISDPNTIGGYSVSASTVSADFTDNTSTTGVVTVGGSATTGTLSTAGQHDWLAVSLTANQAYLFTVTGLTNDASVFVGAADDLDADGQILGQVLTFPSATAQTQTVWFDPSTSGTYYLDISDPNTIGGYSVSASTVSADFTDNTSTTGTVGVLCFLGGTLIATPEGEVPVQQLAVGNSVLTLRGEARRIVWVGAGRVLATRGRRNAATPVIVRKGALADNVPHRDIQVTKGHSLYIDDVLIPVEYLVNHRSILWDDHAQEVKLYHIELATHDVLRANGAPAESYRDDGNRWLFWNANSGWGLPPQEPCAPVLTGGPVVDAVWRRLLERTGPRRSLPLTEDADLHMLVDGQRLDAAERVGEVHVFHLSTVPSALHIVSRAAAPAELGLARDPRVLGVALRRLVVRKGTRFRVTEAKDDRLMDGFHGFEADNGIRWTDGDATVPVDLFDGFTGPLELVLCLGGTTSYVVEGNIQRVA